MIRSTTQKFVPAIKSAISHRTMCTSNSLKKVETTEEVGLALRSFFPKEMRAESDSLVQAQKVKFAESFMKETSSWGYSIFMVFVLLPGACAIGVNSFRSLREANLEMNLKENRENALLKRELREL